MLLFVAVCLFVILLWYLDLSCLFLFACCLFLWFCCVICSIAGLCVYSFGGFSLVVWCFVASIVVIWF